MASTKRQLRPMTHAEMEEEVQAAETKKALEAKGLHKTNFEKIEEFMQWGSQFNQVLVILAVEQYVDNILEHEEEVRKSMAGGLVHPETYIQAAKEWRKQNPKA